MEAHMARKRKRRDLGTEAEERGRSTRRGGASPLTDVDRMALDGPKSKWVESTSPAAGDPLSEDELDGLTLLGHSSLRDDAVPGVSDPIRDGSGGPKERPTGEIVGGRKNPPLVDDAGTGDGGLSASGGLAGGERGHAGRSDAGAGAPDADSGDRPAQHRSTSRLDLDRPGSDARGEPR
jgi:hypothetical protein